MKKKIKPNIDDGIADNLKLTIKRTYPEKICKNIVNCMSGGKFVPEDRRQIFCMPKCGEIFRNDKRHIANNNEFNNEKLLRKYDKKLERLFNFFADKSTSRANVWIEFFRYEEIDLKFSVYESTKLRYKKSSKMVLPVWS